MQVHDSPLFPHIESGWEPLDEQIRWCQDMGQDYLLVDCTDFRNTPESVFAQIFERLDLDFDPAQLSWRPQTQVPLDNLNGGHAHLYGVSWPVPVFNLLTSQYQTCPAFLAKMGCAGMCIFA